MLSVNAKMATVSMPARLIGIDDAWDRPQSRAAVDHRRLLDLELGRMWRLTIRPAGAPRADLADRGIGRQLQNVAVPEVGHEGRDDPEVLDQFAAAALDHVGAA